MNSAGSDSGLIKMSSVSFDKFIRSIHDEEEEEEINEKKNPYIKIKNTSEEGEGGGPTSLSIKPKNSYDRCVIFYGLFVAIRITTHRRL